MNNPRDPGIFCCYPMLWYSQPTNFKYIFNSDQMMDLGENFFKMTLFWMKGGTCLRITHPRQWCSSYVRAAQRKWQLHRVVAAPSRLRSGCLKPMEDYSLSPEQPKHWNAAVPWDQPRPSGQQGQGAICQTLAILTKQRRDPQPQQRESRLGEKCLCYSARCLRIWNIPSSPSPLYGME